ncbi:hypothetical protein B0H11DRAFT_1901486 [Mycena galericulata]|nr:hypothetical protein B0H11DRAFT_1937339 [Mycena galericulata]KAJ7509361.1 hypothetical protein B0H11DRAFT_1901486 [Mycena galericulata]
MGPGFNRSSRGYCYSDSSDSTPPSPTGSSSDHPLSLSTSPLSPFEPRPLTPPAPPLPPIFMPVVIPLRPAMPSTKVILANPPPFFNGNKTKWSNFHDTLSTYIAAYDDELDTQKKRVFFTISFLRNEDGSDCLAADWVRNWKKRTFSAGALPATYTTRH